MHKLYELKDMLCEELEEYGSKESLDVNSLEIIDKLSRALKNVDKIIMMSDEEYSMRDGGRYDMGGSYARGRNARRDSMGRYSRYSRDDGMMEELRDLMRNAPDERTRHDIEKIVNKMEGM